MSWRQLSTSGGEVPGLGEDAGPHPVVRAVTGLLLGLSVGLASAFLLARSQETRTSAGTTDPS